MILMALVFYSERMHIQIAKDKAYSGGENGEVWARRPVTGSGSEGSSLPVCLSLFKEENLPPEHPAFPLLSHWPEVGHVPTPRPTTGRGN